MIIIPSQKFIYLRVPRTGSTSISHFLTENVCKYFHDSFYTQIGYKKILPENTKTVKMDVYSNLDDVTSNYEILRGRLRWRHGVENNNFIEAKKILTHQGISHEAHSFEHLDHSIDIHGVRVAQNFIKQKIATSL